MRKGKDMALLRAAFIAFLFALVDIASAATVTLPEAGLTFNAPDGFTPLDPEEIGLLYQTDRPPKYAIGNEARTTTIGYDLQETLIRPEQLKEAKAAVESQLQRSLPKLVWKQRELTTLHGQQWDGSDGEGADVEFHDIIMLTSRHGRLLRISFNSTQEEFPVIEKALRKSIQSIAFTRK
jgi:hypothetical protein